MKDLTIQFQDTDEKHLYEQIYEYIRDEIKEGKLLAGEKLPSTRSLAEYLQVSRSTVELAYAQLLSEGYIESVPYKGYFICRVEELYRFDEELSVSLQEPEKKQKKGAERYKIDFSPNAVDMSAFPFETWRKITKEILNDDKKELYMLGEPRGDEKLRHTICRYLHASRGVNAEPEQIIIGAGNDYLLMLLQYILGRDICVAFESFSYPRAWKIFSSFAEKMVTVGMDENGICVNELENTGADVAYVMPSHQHPTGIVMPIGRRMELLNWAASGENRYLIEDDYDSEFRYRGKPVPSLQASDKAGKVIYIGTFSKSLAPAIRVSYMVLPPALLEQYEKNCSFFSSTVSRIDQSILNEFITCGAFERHLNKMRKIYKEKHDLLLEELKMFQEQFIISGEYAGLHILLTARKQCEEQKLINAAAEAGVKIYGIKDSRLDQSDERNATILLGYAGLSNKQIREGVDILKKVFEIAYDVAE